MKESNLVLLVDYRGINVEEATSLRNDLRNAKAEYKVIKNRFLKVKSLGQKAYAF